MTIAVLGRGSIVVSVERNGGRSPWQERSGDEQEKRSHVVPAPKPAQRSWAMITVLHAGRVFIGSWAVNDPKQTSRVTGRFRS